MRKKSVALVKAGWNFADNLDVIVLLTTLSAFLAYPVPASQIRSCRALGPSHVPSRRHTDSLMWGSGFLKSVLQPTL